MSLSVRYQIDEATGHFELETSAIVGRGGDVRPADITLSKRHFALIEVAGEWWVEDLGSASGTWLDGEIVRARRPLRSGQTIRAGGTEFVVE